MSRLYLVAIIYALLNPPLHAWWSVEDFPTHKYISDAATTYLEIKYPGQYPDIKKFSGVMVDATYTSDNDRVAHGYDAKISTTAEAGRYAGGDFDLWWKGFALPRYKSSQFDGRFNAYFYMGSMAHLVQDQAVPAHAANIYHGFYKNSWYSYEADPDDMEALVGNLQLATAIAEEVSLGKDLSRYYFREDYDDSLLVVTQEQIRDWRYPVAGPVMEWRNRRYWMANPYPQYAYVGQPFWGDISKKSLYGGWGIYGGPFGEDMYSRFSLDSPISYATDDPSEEIARGQLVEAAAYTAGMLMAVSKSLPPIVKDLSISNSNVVVGQPNSITFTILENRTNAATVYITVDDAGADSPGVAIISKEYQLGHNLEPLSDGQPAGALPFAGTYTIPWDGTMHNTTLKSGAHKLYVRAGDKDGNRSDPVNVDFYLDTGGPRVSLGSQISTIFVAFQGKRLAAPACTNPYAIEGLNLGLAVEDNTSGIKKIELSKIGGTAVYSRSFDTPVHQHIEPVLPAMADGEYLLKAEDVDGNITEAPFKLGTIETPTDIPGSAVTAALYRGIYNNKPVNLQEEISQFSASLEKDLRVLDLSVIT